MTRLFSPSALFLVNIVLLAAKEDKLAFSHPVCKIWRQLALKINSANIKYDQLSSNNLKEAAREENEELHLEIFAVPRRYFKTVVQQIAYIFIYKNI